MASRLGGLEEHFTATVRWGSQTGVRVRCGCRLTRRASCNQLVRLPLGAKPPGAQSSRICLTDEVRTVLFR